MAPTYRRQDGANRAGKLPSGSTCVVPRDGRSFFYLYLMLDVWSRKIVGAAVHEVESAEVPAGLLECSYAGEVVAGHRRPLVLHTDNGGPMRTPAAASLREAYFA